MRSPILLALVASLVLPACESPSPAASPGTSPGLPALEAPYRVLILGDSISIGYTATVKEELADVAIVVRATREDGRTENCEGTNKGSVAIDRWRLKDLKPGAWVMVRDTYGGSKRTKGSP